MIAFISSDYIETENAIKEERPTYNSNKNLQNNFKKSKKRNAKVHFKNSDNTCLQKRQANGKTQLLKKKYLSLLKLISQVFITQQL